MLYSLFTQNEALHYVETSDIHLGHYFVSLLLLLTTFMVHTL
jgi:hypothetical protein